MGRNGVYYAQKDQETMKKSYLELSYHATTSLLSLAKNNCGNAIFEYFYSNGTVRVFECVETESSKYRDWGVRAEYTNGYSALDYAVIYNNLNAVAAILACDHNTWVKGWNPQYTIEELSEALELGKRNAVDNRILALLIAYGAKNDESKPISKYSHIWSSDNRAKYGSRGEVVAPIIELQNDMMVSFEDYSKVTAAENAFMKFLNDYRTACFEELGVTLADFVNNIEKVREKVTQEDLILLTAPFAELPCDHKSLFEDYNKIREILIGAIKRAGGMESFKHEDESMLAHMYRDEIVYKHKLYQKMTERFGKMSPYFGYACCYGTQPAALSHTDFHLIHAGDMLCFDNPEDTIFAEIDWPMTQNRKKYLSAKAKYDAAMEWYGKDFIKELASGMPETEEMLMFPDWWIRGKEKAYKEALEYFSKKD